MLYITVMTRCEGVISSAACKCFPLINNAAATRTVVAAAKRLVREG